MTDRPAGSPGSIREGSRPTLLDRADALVVDLDGVVYRGDRPIPAALVVLAEVRRRDMPVVFLTNNAARTPDDVAARLAHMGFEAHASEVLTSALATATFLRGEALAGRTAFVVGERGIRDALHDAGIEVVDGEPDRVDLVVVGWDRRADYAKLRRASLLVQRGARLVATNADASFPASDGVWPGAGALLSVITTTTGAMPTVIGKPGLPMFDAARAMSGAVRPLMVGDRLDTDIAGAAAAGWDSLLALSGASTSRDLPNAAALPSAVGPDIGAVLTGRIPARFRPATRPDVTALRALITASGLPADGLEDRVPGTVLCEDSGARPDAAGRVAATACLDRVGGHAYLRSVAVRGDVRREGLGMLAASAAIRLRRGPGDPVALLTEDATALFDRLGFQPVGWEQLPEALRHEADLQGCTATATPMMLRN